MRAVAAVVYAPRGKTLSRIKATNDPVGQVGMAYENACVQVSDGYARPTACRSDAGVVVYLLYAVWSLVSGN